MVDWAIFVTIIIFKNCINFPEGCLRICLFCPNMEMLSDLPSNTIDNNWMSIPQITYAVQWLLIRKVLHKNAVYVFMFYFFYFSRHLASEYHHCSHKLEIFLKFAYLTVTSCCVKVLTRQQTVSFHNTTVIISAKFKHNALCVCTQCQNSFSSCVVASITACWSWVPSCGQT